jgi:hypothetical protein
MMYQSFITKKTAQNNKAGEDAPSGYGNTRAEWFRVVTVDEAYVCRCRGPYCGNKLGGRQREEETFEEWSSQGVTGRAEILLLAKRNYR